MIASILGRRGLFKTVAMAGLLVGLAASSRPAHAQVAVSVGAYPAYTTYGGYGYGYRPYRPLRRAYRPAYYGPYARPRYYAPPVYAPVAPAYVAPAPVYAPVAPIYAPPARVYGPGGYYPPML